MNEITDRQALLEIYMAMCGSSTSNSVSAEVAWRLKFIINQMSSLGIENIVESVHREGIEIMSTFSMISDHGSVSYNITNILNSGGVLIKVEKTDNPFKTEYLIVYMATSKIIWT